MQHVEVVEEVKFQPHTPSDRTGDVARCSKLKKEPEMLLHLLGVSKGCVESVSSETGQKNFAPRLKQSEGEVDVENKKMLMGQKEDEKGKRTAECG